MLDKLFDNTIDSYISELSSSVSTPGGGNAISIVNAVSVSLTLMSLRIAILKKDPEDAATLKTEKELEIMKKRSEDLAMEDSARFKKVMSSWRAGGPVYENALFSSAEVSLMISELSLEILKIIDSLDLSRFTMIITDIGIAVALASACFKGGIMNYAVNVKFLSDRTILAGLEQKYSNISTYYESMCPDLVARVKGIAE